MKRKTNLKYELFRIPFLNWFTRHWSSKIMSRNNIISQSTQWWFESIDSFLASIRFGSIYDYETEWFNINMNASNFWFKYLYEIIFNCYRNARVKLILLIWVFRFLWFIIALWLSERKPCINCAGTNENIVCTIKGNFNYRNIIWFINVET